MEIKLLSCPLCMKPHFEGVDALRSSLISVATSQISCPVCNEILLGLDKLTIHLFSHITKDIVQKNMLKLSSGNNNLTHDVKDAVENPHQNIKLCHSTEEDNKTRESKIPDSDMEAKHIRCDICNFTFSDETILDIHQNLLHQTKADKKTGIYNYHCHLCSKKFKLKGSLMVHLRVAHFGFGQARRAQSDGTKQQCFGFDKIDNHQESGVVQQNAPEQFITSKTRENKHWECDVCMKLFTTKYFLKKHKRLHTGEMPYYCSQCNKFFTFQQSYHKHMLYHSSEKPHLCNECGRSFKELSTLHNHERIHSGERPFACETCGKCFRQRVSLLVHRRIHTGVMPYKCTACNKSFRYKVSQKSHKCLANPPGLVIRESNLLEKLIQKTVNKLSSQSLENSSCSSKESMLTTNGIQHQEMNDVFLNRCAVIQIKQNQHKQNGLNESLVQRGPSDFGLSGEVPCSSEEKALIPEDFVSPLHLNTQMQKYFLAPDENGQKNNLNIDNNKSLPRSVIVNERQGTNQDKSLNISENTDFFSLVLSPVLPEVELLSLSNPCSNEAMKNTLETINEESFKNLLYGQSE